MGTLHTDPTLIPLPSEAFGSLPPLGGRRVLTLDTLTDVLDQALNAAGINQSELARRLGLKSQSLDQYKQGRRPNPSLEWLVRYLQTCGCRLLVEYPSEML